MKFVAFFEHTREDTDKLTPKSQKWAEALRKGPEKHIKRIFPPHYFVAVNEKGNPNGLSIFETDNEEKLIDHILSYSPEMKMKIVPLVDSGKMVELYTKMKK